MLVFYGVHSVQTPHFVLVRSGDKYTGHGDTIRPMCYTAVKRAQGRVVLLLNSLYATHASLIHKIDLSTLNT